MIREREYNRKEFVEGVRAGVSAFSRDTYMLKSGNLHIKSSYVEHWHAGDWMELPENSREQISAWVEEYRANVVSWESSSLHTPHNSQYSLQILEDISHELLQRHVIF